MRKPQIYLGFLERPLLTNYQKEHHLLPMVCHVHNKELSKIVIETAKEHGMPYNSNRTFFEAIKVHAQMIYKLGNMEQKLV